MPRIEQPDLHLLVRRDIRHKLSPDPFPWRSAVGKVVLDDPLAKRLAGDRPFILQTHLTIEILDILRCCHRRYPIDHRIRKADLALDPPRKLHILLAGEAKHHFPRHVSVVLDVVTGLDGKSW